MNRLGHGARALGLAGTVAAVLAAPVLAQDTAQPPLSSSVFAGAAGVMYTAPSDDLGHGMTMVHFMPTFLTSMGRDLLFEGEVHFTPAEDGVETEIEYAQIDYQRFDHLQIIAGQFLLPFGVFGERLHMAWINKMPDLPLLYADETVPEGQLMSLPSDFGVQLRYARPLNEKTDLNVSLYATQGPHMVAGTGAPGELPDVSLGNTLMDNNGNKLVGARAGLVFAPQLEVYVSGFASTYDAESSLNYDAANLAAIWRPAGFQLLGELAHVWQQFQGTTEIETLGHTGYFVQASRRFGAFEPVARWEQLTAGKAGGTTIEDGTHRFGLGADYWLDTTMPVKAVYEWSPGGNDQFTVQWVFGF